MLLQSWNAVALRIARKIALGNSALKEIKICVIAVNYSNYKHLMRNVRYSLILHVHETVAWLQIVILFDTQFSTWAKVILKTIGNVYSGVWFTDCLFISYISDNHPGVIAVETYHFPASSFAVLYMCVLRCTKSDISFLHSINGFILKDSMYDTLIMMV